MRQTPLVASPTNVSSPPMALSRRAFLTARKPRSTAAVAPGAPRDPFSPAASTGDPDGYWVHLSRSAMACRFEITIPAELSHRLDAARAALDGVDALEEQLSVFRDTSAVSAINRDAHEAPVPIDDDLFALLRRCADWSTATDGAFDITAGPLSRTWGFLRREGRIPTEAEIEAALAITGMGHVHLEESRDESGGAATALQTVRFDRPGVSLNLGAVGKGHALDVVAGGLARGGVETALLSAGSSSFLALGNGPTGDGFRVGVRDPFDHKRRYGTLTLAGCALGVSGAGEQFFEVGGRRYGHILDPRRGWPVEGRALAVVVARTAAEADALATAFFVAGADLAQRYIARHPDVSALVIDAPSRQGAPQITALGRLPNWRLNRAV
ncbi:MAG TPA: FAD:protein FMN transferase [Polyangia bacterium]